MPAWPTRDCSSSGFAERLLAPGLTARGVSDRTRLEVGAGLGVLMHRLRQCGCLARRAGRPAHTRLGPEFGLATVLAAACLAGVAHADPALVGVGLSPPPANPILAVDAGGRDIGGAKQSMRPLLFRSFPPFRRPSKGPSTRSFAPRRRQLPPRPARAPGGSSAATGRTRTCLATSAA